MRALQEVQDVFLEVRSGIDLGFVQERRRAATFYLSGDLFSYPCVDTAVTDEHQSARSARIVMH
jgi:hypothetical protein